jgi:hypothetical protein
MRSSSGAGGRIKNRPERIGAVPGSLLLGICVALFGAGDQSRMLPVCFGSGQCSQTEISRTTRAALSLRPEREQTEQFYGMSEDGF